MPEEAVDDGAVSGAAGVVAVAIVGIELLVPGADPGEQRMAGLRGADVVLPPDVHDDRAGDAVGEVVPVEVGDGGLHVGAAIGVSAQVVVDLLVRVGVRQRDGVHEAAEVRGAGAAARTSGRMAAVVMVRPPPWLLPVTPMRCASTSGRDSRTSMPRQVST